MSANQVRRTLNRLAYEIVEKNRGADNLVMIGILNTGSIVAERLAAHIDQIEGISVPRSDLDISAFRDDRESEPGAEEEETGHLPDLEGRDVILVDDVLFTGRTVRAALDAVVKVGRPASIQLVALIDRGHREYPIQPDFVGRVLPTKHRERIEVMTDGDLTVDVVE